MKFISVCAVILLAGCAGPSVKTSFPDLPEKLMTAPAELTVLDENSIETININDKASSEVKLSELIDTVTKNYTITNRIREQLIDLQLWVKTQRAINP